MKAKTFLTVLMLLFGFSPATFATSMGGERRESFLCEYRLARNLSKNSLKILDQRILNIPFHVQSIVDGTTEHAWKKLGFEAAPENQTLNRWVAALTVNDEALDPIQFHIHTLEHTHFVRTTLPGFPDTVPTAWQFLSLEGNEVLMEYETLVQKYPLEALDLDDPLVLFGFHSDADSDGVRRFVYLEDSEQLVYGIDVPCGKLALYTDDEDPTRTLTAAKKFCRLPIITFTHSGSLRR